MLCVLSHLQLLQEQRLQLYLWSVLASTHLRTSMFLFHLCAWHTLYAHTPTHAPPICP